MLALASLTLLLASPPCDLPALSPEYRPLPGESLAYDVGFLGAEGAGKATVSVLGPAADGSPRVRVEAHHDSLFGRARFRAESVLSRRSLRPLRFHDEQEGRGGQRTTDADMERSPLAVRVEWRRGARSGMNAYLRSPGLLDFASAVPYLRAAALAPGAPFCFDVVGGTSYFRVEGRVAASPEWVSAPAGAFPAYRLDATLRRADPGGGASRVALWLGAEPRRLLVAAEAETPLGPIRARLVAYTPGHPR